MSDPEPKPVRADARRNREKLLAAARAAFTTADDTVPLESIAREAGVGIGTLYRHFPTREALIETVYATELDDIATCAPALLDESAPADALRAWMDRYAAFTIGKRGMLDTLRAGWASGSMTTPATRERLTAAVGKILTAGARTGALRADVEPDDVITMLRGVFLATNPMDDQERTGRLLDLVLDGLRPHTGRNDLPHGED